MKVRHHVVESLKFERAPSPWPRMVLAALSVGVPLIVGLLREDLHSSIYGSLFGFILILNDHFGSLRKRLTHLITAYVCILGGVLAGIIFHNDQTLILIALFIMAFLLGRAKGLGIELERMLLFTTLQFLAASQNPGLTNDLTTPVFYSTLSLINYLLSLFVVYFFFKHEPNFQRSKYRDFLHALRRKGTLRYALVLALTACLGFLLAQQFHVERGYWVVGTILIVMMPDRNQSLYKSFQRLLGTLLGVFIAAVVLRFVNSEIILIAFSTLSAFLAPLGLLKNYWLGNVFIAGLIILFLDISMYQSSVQDFNFAWLRISDIGIGCLFGVIGTFVAFPPKRRRSSLKRTFT